MLPNLQYHNEQEVNILHPLKLAPQVERHEVPNRIQRGDDLCVTPQIVNPGTTGTNNLEDNVS